MEHRQYTGLNGNEIIKWVKAHGIEARRGANKRHLDIIHQYGIPIDVRPGDWVHWDEKRGEFGASNVTPKGIQMATPKGIRMADEEVSVWDK